MLCLLWEPRRPRERGPPVLIRRWGTPPGPASGTPAFRPPVTAWLSEMWGPRTATGSVTVWLHLHEPKQLGLHTWAHASGAGP